MKKDAHFYAVLALSRACGFKKKSANRIAYASQFVDDAKINLIFLQNIAQNEVLDSVENTPAFFNIATCHSYFRIDTFNYEAMVNNTTAFHFVPGCSGKRFTKKLRCKEESPIILDILAEAFQEDNLIKFGMVLHSFADTFSHQGFSGMLSKVNAINNCQVQTFLSLRHREHLTDFLRDLGGEKFEKYFDRVMPAYGHAQAMDFPDLPYLVWSYEYDHSDDFRGSHKRVEVDNRERYQRAFLKIKQHLEHYLTLYPHHRDQSIKFDNFDLLWQALIFNGHDQCRIKNWQKLMLKHGLFEKNDKALWTYEDDTWLQQAFVNYNPKKFNNRRVEGAICVDNFENTHWYHFILAVKWYKKKFQHYCNEHQLCVPM
ncbi:MAG TPA: hypothetical protein GX523_13700 [Desulfitobacterium dehalogenans]|uniref:Uncharacterized protein n=1 Tax=Desulfitobacterium dehalogenans TaxID=36854 RepID=A0A7C6Z5L3_9FIRM|nr:hypothetical protein [Desulfitobacterium dehalogenans]